MKPVSRFNQGYSYLQILVGSFSLTFYKLVLNFFLTHFYVCFNQMDYVGVFYMLVSFP